MIHDFVFAFVDGAATALVGAIFARVILSWLPTVRLPYGLGEFVWDISEPILAPIRRALPFMAGLDFSPIIAILAIQAARVVLSMILRLAL